MCATRGNLRDVRCGVYAFELAAQARTDIRSSERMLWQNGLVYGCPTLVYRRFDQRN